MKDAIKRWYYGHIQKYISGVLALCDIGALLGFMGGYQDEITTLVGSRVYVGIRLGLASIIFIRARQHTKAVTP